jgi:hypothetical protein
MKTNTMTLPSNPIRFATFGRRALTTLCVSLVSFAAVPKALAAGADGTYKFKDASGSLKVGGEKFDVPDSLVKKLAGFTLGQVTIQDNTLKIRKYATAKIVENVGHDLDLDIEASVKGSNKIVLNKSGSLYTGKSATPIVASFEGDFHGASVSGDLITKVSATVNGNILTVVIKFSGEVIGEDFGGKLILIGKR